MRLSRFFTDTPLSLGDHELPEAQAHYISRVLRMTEGDAVQLFDGSGQEFRGTLLEVGKKRVTVQLTESFAGQAESPLHIHLGQGLSRGERMDWAIQKAWLKQTEADLKLVLHPVAEPMISHAKPSSLAFLIGPEGGLTDNEVETAQGAGYHAARLGPRVLRTETAPVVALSVAQQLWGDF